MATELEHNIQLQKVRDYYLPAQKYYEHLWYSGNQGLGLHYGLWTENVKSRIEAITKENEILADLAEIKTGDMVLDAGCGVAGSGIWLTKNRWAKVIGINIVQEQLNIANKLKAENRVENRLHLTNADYHNLPFLDKSFDVFWSLESIEHSDDVEKLIKDVYRVLKSGGRAVIAGTFRGDTGASEEQKQQMYIGFRAAGAFNDFRSADETAKVMKKNNFTNIQNYDVTDLVMKSAKQMHDMCSVALPGAKFSHRIGVVSQIMVDNTAWGIYQKDLFKSGVTSYHILVAEK